MKRIVIAVTVAAWALIVGARSQSLAQIKTATAEQELLKLEQDWAKAEAKNDMSFFERILAKDYVLTDANGAVWNKPQELAASASKEELITSDDVRVRVYGDAAVVTGRDTIKETSKGKDTIVLYRWTDTWIKNGGGWQCVATHTSKIAEK
jgi:ketosteroid isomerase-like protein